MGRLKRLVAAVVRSRPYRANERLARSRGAILSAGIAFYGVFSLFPLLVLGFTVLGLVVGSDAALQEEVVLYVDDSLPGVIGDPDADDPDERGIVTQEALFGLAGDRGSLGLSALVGILALLFTGLGWIAALREGIRGVFRMPVMDVDIVRAKLYDLGVVLSLGALIVVIALVGVIGASITDQLLDLLGLGGSAVADVAARVGLFVAVLTLNTVLFTVLYRVLARTSASLRTVAGGALLAAVGVAGLQQVLGLVLGGVGGGLGFLEAFVPILALFVWLNLTARVMLFGAAWVAVGSEPEPDAASVRADESVPDRVPLPRMSPPVLPRRWSDRAVLGAGVVLGAAGIGLAQVTGGAVRALGAGLRGLVRRED